MGACGIVSRIVLGVVNVIFLLLGIALVVTASLLKWGNLAKLKDLQATQTVISFVAIDGVAIALICIGAFAIFLSLIGLIGLGCSNRCLLIFYEVIVIIVFLAHLAALIVLLVAYPLIEKGFKEVFNSVVTDLQGNTPGSSSYQTNCNLMYNISNIFSCCGGNGPSDLSVSVQGSCCIKPTPTAGCTNQVFGKIKQISVYLLIIPTAVLLFVELVCAITVPFLVVSISRSKYA